MKKTGVFATKEEIKELTKLATQARSTPVIAFSVKGAMSGGMAGNMWKIAQERCHEIALKHGLPEIKGFYGLDQNGEFVATE